MNKIKAIIKGWANFAFENKEVEAMAKKRADICASCHHSKKMKYELIEDNRITEITGLCCGLCGCPLSTLLRQSDKRCDDGKW